MTTSSPRSRRADRDDLTPLRRGRALPKRLLATAALLMALAACGRGGAISGSAEPAPWTPPTTTTTTTAPATTRTPPATTPSKTTTPPTTTPKTTTTPNAPAKNPTPTTPNAPAKNPTPTTQATPPKTTAPQRQQSSSVTDNQLDRSATTTAYVEAVIKHADIVWTNWFKAQGLPEPMVGYKIIEPGESYQSNCGIDGQYVFAADYTNAFYCPKDSNSVDAGMLVIPVETMAKMWQGNILDRQVGDGKLVGDFAAAAITAHEFGHHIADELATDVGVSQPSNPNIELLADCFSGVWTYAVHLDDLLAPNDETVALNALGAIGDNLGSHGTPAQRQTAFEIGAGGTTNDPRGGVPQTCTAAYWPGFPQ